MKINLWSALVICMLVSCKSNSKRDSKDSVNNKSEAVAKSSNDESPNLIKKFKPIIQGVWVKSDFINEIRKSMSPYESRSKLRGVASIIINLPNNKPDSVNIGFSLNNHEGSEFVLYLKKGQIPSSLKTGLLDYENRTNFYELGYSIKNRDTLLILYHYNNKNKLIDTTLFLRVAEKAQDEDDAAWGIQYITNKSLFSGVYLLDDSTGIKGRVEFNNGGISSGFEKFNTYYINTDFETGPENNLDQIYFQLNSTMQKRYSFKIIADTLNLYETLENADSTKLILGKLKYKLVRQK